MARIVELAISQGRAKDLYVLLIRKDYPVSQKRYAKLRNILRNSDDKETLEIYELGDKSQRTRALRLYSFEMLRSLCHKYVKLNDHEKGSYYFGLLTERYEWELTRSKLDALQRDRLTSRFYESVAMFLVRLVNYGNATVVLGVLAENQVRITGRLLNMIISSLRAKGQYDVIFDILRVAPKLLGKEERNDLGLKENLTREFFTALSYEVSDMKIILAYVNTIYPGSFDIVNDELRLIPFLYRKDTLESFNIAYNQDHPDIAKAEINPWYHFPPNTVIPMKSLTVIYTALYNYIKAHPKLQTHDNLTTLHAYYLKHIHNTPELLPEMDDWITNLFVNLALKYVHTKKTAFQILLNHVAVFPETPIQSSTITSVFLHHGTSLNGPIYEKFLEWFDKYSVQVSPEFCIAVIKKLVYVGDIKTAKTWFDKMTEELKYPITSHKLIQVALKNGWKIADQRSNMAVVTDAEQSEVTQEMIDMDEEAEEEKFKEGMKSILEKLVTMNKDH